MEVVTGNTLLPGDPRLIDHIVCELKSQGIFDQFRKECIADVDTKPAYQNLRQRVEGSVTGFLKTQTWKSDLNKNQLREMLRKNIYESGFLETGVERIVDQVVNPKINTVFLPQVEDVVYKFLGLEKPTRSHIYKNGPLNIDTDLLPTDLDPISPDSEVLEKSLNKNNDTEKLDDSKADDFESPPFEPINEQSVFSQQDESSNDSHLSGISGLTSHDSNMSIPSPTKNYFAAFEMSNQDSQLSKVSSNSRLSIITTEDKLSSEKMDISDDTQTSKIEEGSNSKILNFGNQSSENGVSNFNIKEQVDVIMTAEQMNIVKMEEYKEVINDVLDKDTREIEMDVCDSQDKSDFENSIKEELKEIMEVKVEKIEEQVKIDDSKNEKNSKESRSRLDSEKRRSKHSESKERKSDRKSESDRDRKNDKDKEKRDKEKSRTSSSSKDKYRDKSKDSKSKEKEKDSKKDDKDKSKDDRSKSSSSSSKHSSRDKERSSSKSDRKESSSRDKDKSESRSKSKPDKPKSEDTKKTDESKKAEDSKKTEEKKEEVKKNDDSKRKSDSKSKSKSDTSKSSSSSSRDRKSSSSNHKDRKDSKDPKKSSKSGKDDHFSSKEKKSDTRRSADRDSNDGSSGIGSVNNNKDSNSSSKSKSSENSSSGSNSGDGGQSDKSENMDTEQKINENTASSSKTTVKYLTDNITEKSELKITPPKCPDGEIIKLKKPKFASNIYEARRLMKVRKKMEKMEKKRQREMNLQAENLRNEEREIDEFEQREGAKKDAVTGEVCIEEIEDSYESEERTDDELQVTKNSKPIKTYSVTKSVVSEVKAVEEDDSFVEPAISVISKESWDAIEARINQSTLLNVDYNSYVDENADSCSSNKSNEKCEVLERKSSDDEDCLYFNPEVSPTTERYLKRIDYLQKIGATMENFFDSKNSKTVGSSQSGRRPRKPNSKYNSVDYDIEDDLDDEEMSSFDNITNNKLDSTKKKRGLKRRTEGEIDGLDTDNNNKKIHVLEDLAEEFSEYGNTSNSDPKLRPSLKGKRTKTTNDSYMMPLSPESDVSSHTVEVKNSLRKASEERDALVQQLIQPINHSTRSNRGHSLANQRYSSDDLYKPRPLFTGSRRSRGLVNNSDKGSEETTSKRR